MKFFCKSKDGGPESTVTAYTLIEIKSVFSIILLKFEGLSRDVYHTHAFDCISWVLKGKLVEYLCDGIFIPRKYRPSILPVITRRETYHKVDSVGTTWVISFRGSWKDSWKEFFPHRQTERTLTHGRIEV